MGIWGGCMASHFKWYPASEEVIVPWNARYSFPSQSNKAEKMTPRIPPKNGNAFNPGQVIRLEFPAQGYVNPLNTTLEFDVTLYGYTSAANQIVRFQNNIQSLFQRVRLLYGATPLEDMINYNQIVRNLTEWTGPNTQNTMDPATIGEGIGGFCWGTADNFNGGPCNVRQKYIQGVSRNTAGGGVAVVGTAFGAVPQETDYPAGLPAPTGVDFSTRRYQVNFALGLFTQDKLIPTKFMASQLAIEITLEQAANCMFVVAATGAAIPSYGIGNVNLIPEILQFDASYDSMFLAGLRDGGVPLKFSSWHTFIFSSQSASTLQLLVQERSRSVKALFMVQRKAQPAFVDDNGATFYETSSAGGSLQTYQYRVGGRYFPAAPVQCSSTTGSAVSNGGCEAYVELTKALNIVGDYRLSSGVHTDRWAVVTQSGVLPNKDFSYSITAPNALGYCPYLYQESSTNSYSGNTGSACFTCAVNLETSNGVEISGLNAEEQVSACFCSNL